MPNPWFKFYGGDYLNDPKLLGMDGNKRSCWITLLSYASISDTPGTIKYLTEEQLMIQAGIVMGGDEWDKTIGVLKVFQERAMITHDNALITVLNWQKRQQIYSPEYDRLKRWRENHKDDNGKKKNKKEKKNNTEILPDWLDTKTWNDWIEYRKEKNKSLTQKSIELQLKELAKDIPKHKAIIEQSIRNGWIGLFPLKVDPKNPREIPERKYPAPKPEEKLTPEQEREKLAGLAMLRKSMKI